MSLWFQGSSAYVTSFTSTLFSAQSLRAFGNTFLARAHGRRPEEQLARVCHVSCSFWRYLSTLTSHGTLCMTSSWLQTPWRCISSTSSSPPDQRVRSRVSAVCQVLVYRPNRSGFKFAQCDGAHQDAEFGRQPDGRTHLGKGFVCLVFCVPWCTEFGTHSERCHPWHF